MNRLDHTVTSPRDHVETVSAVVSAAVDAGFKVQQVHDVAKTLAEKGFRRDPVTIIEVCNARYAAAVLEADIMIGLMMPCPIMVWDRDGVTSVSTMPPTLIARFFPDAGVDDTAGEVERIMLEMIERAVS